MEKQRERTDLWTQEEGRREKKKTRQKITKFPQNV